MRRCSGERTGAEPGLAAPPEPSESPRAYAKRCAQALDHHLEEHHRETAAFIVEPLVEHRWHPPDVPTTNICSARGICNSLDPDPRNPLMRSAAAPPRFLRGKASRTDSLCPIDVTGGYLPLSVVLTTDTFYAAFYDDSVTRGFLHSHSYTGNALACRAH